MTRPTDWLAKTNPAQMEIGGRLKVSMRSLPVDMIRADSAYQRDVSAAWVSAHKPFDAARANSIIVSLRAGTLFVVDGRHRVELARESGVRVVNAVVVEGWTQQEEARAFIGYQRERRNVGSFDEWKAGITGQVPEFLEIDGLVRRLGFHIMKGGGNSNIAYGIRAIDGLRYVYGLGGIALLESVLTVIRDNWVEEEAATSGRIIRGLGIFLHSFGEQPTFSPDTFKRVLVRNAPLRIMRLAQSIAEDRGSFAADPSKGGVAIALRDQYDKNAPRGTAPLGPIIIRGQKRVGR